MSPEKLEALDESSPQLKTIELKQSVWINEPGIRFDDVGDGRIAETLRSLPALERVDLGWVPVAFWSGLTDCFKVAREMNFELDYDVCTSLDEDDDGTDPESGGYRRSEDGCTLQLVSWDTPIND